jgi:hypothetical protein
MALGEFSASPCAMARRGAHATERKVCGMDEMWRFDAAERQLNSARRARR